MGYRLFKTTYKDSHGQTRTAAKWYVEFRDQLDMVRRLPAFPSKAASDEFGRNLVKLVAYFKGSGGQTDPALSTWLAGLSPKTIGKLAAIGLVAPERSSASKLLTDHLADFAAALRAKGNTVRHVGLVETRARKVLI